MKKKKKLRTYFDSKLGVTITIDNRLKNIKLSTETLKRLAEIDEHLKNIKLPE